MNINPNAGLAILCLLILNGMGMAQDQKLTPNQEAFFETRIRPVLVKECYGCHSSKTGQVRGGLLLDTREGTHVGGDSGPAVVPTSLDDSLLWNAINYEDYRMPPGGKLADDVIDDFRQWIEMGAPDPRDIQVDQVQGTISDADIESGKQFWSFVRPRRPQTPTVERSSWPRTEIDHFVLSKLEAAGLQPSADAKPATLLRRMSFDLVGLPPTPEQARNFSRQWKKDPDEAIASAVDRMLESSAFGERWGRHWLDVARYAESSGKERNMTFPHAWRYRDYVIDSFNEDKPYDRFIKEQIAGDLLPARTDDQWAENLVGTGFLALGPKTLTEQNGRQFNLDLIDEQIDVSTRVVMGVSVACARCHDHKFDPIPQRDYYALAGIFQSTTTHYGTLDTFQNRRPTSLLIYPGENDAVGKQLSSREMAELKDDLEEKRRELAEAQRARREMRRDGDSAAARSILSVARASSEFGQALAKFNSYDENGRPLAFVMGVQDADNPVDAYFLVRGEFDKPTERVKRGVPQVLADQPIRIDRRNSGRRELAEWMANEDNPLTARVMVNRIWQHLLGNGIVRTPENFGATGMQPTHPELLDFLAVEFMERGWSVKQLIKQIVTSRIYRTNSEYDVAAFRQDPENKLLWRVDPRRLDAEVIRDSILAVSGQLDRDRPRGSVVSQIGPALVRDGQLLASRDPQPSMMSGRSDRNRNPYQATEIDQSVQYRSVYLPIVRDQIARALDVFDFAESSMVIGKRESSNTPDQGLFFLNNPFVLEQSDAMAKRLLREAERPEDQVELAFLLVFGREPTRNERKAAAEFFSTFEGGYSRTFRDEHSRKLSAFCQALFASAEFRFVN